MTGKPDLVEWADTVGWSKQLHEVIEGGAKAYRLETDISKRRGIAKLLLQFVVGKIQQIPFESDINIYGPLKDLVFFLEDLEKGRAHPWSIPTNFGGTNITTTADSEFRLWVKAIVQICLAQGLKPTPTYRLVARKLTESGRTGRKKNSDTGTLGPVAWQSVRRWANADTPPESRLALETIVGFWAKELNSRKNAIAIYGLSAVLEEIVRGGVSLDHHRDLFHFEPSE